MIARAISKYVRVSPFKLRPIVNVVRGSRVSDALALLKTQCTKRSIPLLKTISAAYYNAVNNDQAMHNTPMNQFIMKEIRVDAGPIVKYYKPGAMGRSQVQRRRLSHVRVVVEKHNS